MTDFFSKKDIQALLDAEDKAIENFTLKLKNKIERQLKKAVVNLNKQNTLEDVTRELSKLSGLNLPKEIQAELNNYISLYTKSIEVVKDSIQTVNNVANVFRGEDQQVIDQLFDFSKTRLITTIEQTYNEFKDITYQGIVSGQLPNLNTVVETITDSFESRLPNEVNTQLAGFQRSVTLKKADDLGLTHFLYAGGLIKTSRTFCQERAGKIYSFEEAKKWDNEQSLPVIPYLGGWNCRHAIVPMTREKAIENGYGG